MRAALDAIVPDIAKGLRAAVATVVPFFLAGQLGRPELVWIALGGWLGSLADPGGARLSRAMGIFVFATVGGTMVAIAHAVAPWPWLAALFLAAFAFATSMLRAVGGWGASIGVILLIATTVAVSSIGGAPLRDGLLFFAGASWAMLLSSIVWPVWTHRPVRRSIARLFTELSTYASELAACIREIESSASHTADARWGPLARKHQRAIRSAIENARTVAVALRTRRSGESRLGANLRLLIGNAELEFFALIALGEEIETLADARNREAAARTLDALVGRYRETSDRLLMRNVGEVDLGQRPDADLTPSSPVALLAARLMERSHLALAVARAPGEVTVNTEGQARPATLQSRVPDLRDDLEDLGDALSPRSPIFRHAVRVMLTVAAAFTIARVVSPTHVPWVTITAIAVLQPYPGTVVRRAIERVVGTVLGSVAAVAIMLALHTPWALALIMFPLSAASVVTRPRSYRLFTFFLTPVFVLFAAHGESDWWTAAARTGDALVGGLIALVFALVLFPSREQKRLVDALGAVVDALSHYAETMFDILEKEGRLERGEGRGGEASARTNTARRRVGIALGEAETSLERMLAEPRSFQSRAEDAVQLMTYARRFSSALTALDLQLGTQPLTDDAHRGESREEQAPERPWAELVAPLRAYVETVLAAVDSFVREGGQPPLPAPPVLALDPLAPDGRALSRVLRHAELVASIVTHDRPRSAHDGAPRT